jgi:hypothetical protein
MLVRFYTAGSLAGIYLYCKGCDLIQFHGGWENADPSVTISQGRDGPICTVSDGDRLRIVSSAAFLAETSELISLPEGSTSSR